MSAASAAARDSCRRFALVTSLPQVVSAWVEESWGSPKGLRKNLSVLTPGTAHAPSRHLMQTMLPKGKLSGTPRAAERPLFLGTQGKVDFFCCERGFSMLNITVNGKAFEAPEGASVTDVVLSLKADPAKVVVERNREIVPKDAFGQTVVADGDEIEVIQFVGGG